MTSHHQVHHLSGTRIAKPGDIIDVESIVMASHAGKDPRQVHRASFKPPVDLPVHPPVPQHMVPISVTKNPEPLPHKMTGVEAIPTGMKAPKTPSCYGMFSPNLTRPRGDIPLAYIG
jgi:hypothetical protein